MLNPNYLELVKTQLTQFATQANFETVLTTAFGTKIDRTKIFQLRQQWLKGDFSLIPPIDILTHGELGDANGGYATSSDRIFVSSDFLAAHQNDPKAITNLLLEEFGHKLDRVFNGNIDSAGDEGAIFAALAQGQTLSTQTLAQLRAEDDHRIISVDDKLVAIEMEIWTGTSGDDNHIGIDIDTSNTLYGGAGNDTLIGGTLNAEDLLDGEAGDDNLSGGFGNDRLYGGTGNDILDGGDGNDLLDGGNGNDLLDGWFGDDNLDGGNGDDILDGGNGNDILDGDVGNDILDGGVGNDTLTGGAGNDTLTGGNGTDSLAGGVGNDTYLIDADLVDTGVDTINDVGGAGSDTLDFSTTMTKAINVNLGITTTQAVATGLQIIIPVLIENATGGSLNDILTGNNLDNTLLGGAGNDTINGGIGDDYFNGGTGNDTYIIDADIDTGSDTIAITANTAIGIDTLNLSSTTTKDININLSATNTQDIATNVQLTIALGSVANIYSGNGNDLLTGNNLNNILDGGLGDDEIDGGDGNDTLSGGAGFDTLYGGRSRDTLSGGDGDDSLYGEAGNDTLDGGLGADIMLGGIGDDTYIVDNIEDIVSENTLEGTDTVKSSINYVLGANVENLTLTGTFSINATGNALKNIIKGNSGNNTIYGGDGNDIVDGGDGNDTIYLGAGNDSLDVISLGNDIFYGGTGDDFIYGYTGNETYYGEAGNDILNGDAGNDILNGGVGNDTLHGGVGEDTYVIDADVDFGTDTINEVALIGGTDTLDFRTTTLKAINVDLNLTSNQLVSAGVTAATDVRLVIPVASIENVYGGSLNDTLTGNSLNNVLLGGVGNDSLTGGTGDDTYIIDADVDLGLDTINETLINGGTDTLDFRATTTKAININLNTTTIQTVATGVQLVIPVVSIENVYGGTLNDTLIGNNLNDTLDGGDGNDTLSGGNGFDTLTGGVGNDTLTGGVGNDTLTGGNNDDMYIIDADVDLGLDTINEISLSGGIDTLDFRTTTTKAININLNTTTIQTVATGVQLVMPVVSIENVYGGTLNDTLAGNGLNNLLSGGAGNDTLSGGLGNDSFLFNGGVAITGAVTVASLLGKDTISDFSLQDKIVLSKSTFAQITTALGGLTTADFASFANDAAVLASTSSAAILYSSGTGNLFYNQNGNVANVGANGGIFATVTANLLLTFNDFSVVA